MKEYKNLEKVFRQIADLNHVAAICHWDEAVMMPAGGGSARAQALATLQALRHQLLIDPRIGEWIVEAKNAELSSSWAYANLKWMEIEHLKAVCVPTDLVEHSELAFVRCEQAWRILRAENNWHDFLPLLEENVSLIREKAQIKAETFAIDVYDSLIDDFSPGLSQAIIEPIFSQLEKFLPNFIHAAMAKQKTLQQISGHFPKEKQRQLGLELMKKIGFDFNHGRLDISHHPFCGGVAEDVRITTRYSEHEFFSATMGICHETGHALYELGLPKQWLDQPVGHALGMAMHESQSLLIEMQACRSAEFLDFLTPLLIKYFGNQSGFTPENLLSCYTTVKPGLIRVDADEVCYPLHIILRYDLEKKLINNQIKVKDLPELWDHLMQQLLGLSTADDYQNGVMQDVHWPSGCFGYFPAYTIGAIIAAQLFQAAQRQYPTLVEDLTQGNFENLVSWLRQNIHSQGRLLSMNDLLVQATSQPLSAEAFLSHLKRRYLP